MRLLHAEHKQHQINAIRGIIFGRWVIIVGLTFVGILHQIGDVAIISISLKNLGLLILVPSIYNLAYSFYLKYQSQKVSDLTLRLITFGQMIIDQLMITAVIYMSGGIESISFVLYFLPLLAATILYREIEIIVFTFLTAFWYSSVITLEYFSLIPHFPRYHFDPGFIFNPEITLANTVSIVLIILMSGMFLVFINRIIFSREMQIMLERDKVRLILNSLEEGIIMLDTSRRILLINPPARYMLELKENFNDQWFDKNKFPKMFHELLEALESQPPAKRLGQEIILGEPPRTTYLHLDSLPIRSLSGQIISWVKVLKDVTREKELEEVKSDFISIAAHQLRTPLSGLKWFFKMMLDGDAGKVPKQQYDLLRKAYERNEQVIEIVNNLLDISEIEEGRFPYEFKSADFCVVIKEVIKNANVNAKAKVVKIAYESSPASVFMEMDEEKMRMALQNVVDNAVKYSRVGKEVKVNVVKRGQKISVNVADEGIGITTEDQPKIFMKFFRGRNAKEKEPTGSGLGMYIVRNIISKHRGEITFKSKINRGTTFTITLPVSQR